MTTAAVVFITFVIRLTFACLNSYALYFAIDEQHLDDSGCVAACSACHSTPYIINRFLFFFPELRALVIFISSPIALLVACWGMTSEGKPCVPSSPLTPHLHLPPLHR
jgi:hypothetical protein